MILHPLRCAAVRDLPEPIACIEVDSGNSGPWRFNDGQPLDVWRHAGRPDHLDIGLASLGLLHTVHRSIRSRGGPDVQEPGFGIKRATFPVNAARTREREGA